MTAAVAQCQHLKVVKQNGQTYCGDCCEELMSFSSDETQFFEDITTTLAADRKPAKSIRKELDALPLPDHIKDAADRIYATRVGNNTFRSKVRQEVKFGCIFDAYKDAGIYKDPNEIATMVGIKRRGMSRGILRCSFLCTGKESSTSNISITALHLVPGMLTRCGVEYDASHLEDIEAIYNYTKERSELLNRSKPQSIAAALIYFYLCKTDKDRKVNKGEVAKSCGISSMTLNKLHSELDAVCGGLLEE